MVEHRSPSTVKSSGQSDAAVTKLFAESAGNTGAAQYQTMRQLGGRAYQVRAVIRAADHFVAQRSIADRDTGSWLIASAVGASQELAADLDNLSRSLKDRAKETSVYTAFQKLRARAHQLHAASRAADHFLEQDNSEERNTGSWLIACALGLSDTLTSDIENLASSLKRPSAEVAPEVSDVTSGTRRAS